MAENSLPNSNPLRKNRPNRTTPASFWANVTKTDTGCWEWAGVRSAGYGKVSYESKNWNAHRLAFFLHHGREAEGRVVHSCKNRPCVNPSHLREDLDVKFFRKVRSDADRFFDRVQKTDTCWLWQGTLGDLGYGELYARGRKNYKAHRLSYELHHGEIPEGLFVCHKCDVRNCVNPDHLFAGTHDDNMADKVSKGRQAAGKRSNGKGKLTEDQVLAIAKDGRQRLEIAREYGIHPTAVWQIRVGLTWSWLTGISNQTVKPRIHTKRQSRAIQTVKDRIGGDEK